MVSLNIIHLIGVVLGLGVATGLDLFLVNLIARNTFFKSSQFRLLELLSSLVVMGLVLLWFSGLGFLLEYQLSAPEKLHNTKLQAKIIIVILLTLNGLFIHFYFLKVLKHSIGKNIFTQLRLHNPSLIFISGAVSFSSWYAAFTCGAIRLLNNMLTFQQFMVCYLILLLFFIIFSLLFLKFLYFKHIPGTEINPMTALWARES